MRRIVLHIGAPKTGTSAIQAALVRNRTRLAELGLHYPAAPNDPEAAAGEITSGNGMWMAAALNPTLRIASRYCADPIAANWSLFTRDDPIVLFSGEHMYFLQPERLADLAARFANCGAILEVVLFARSLLEHAFSYYNQMVKRHRCTVAFGEFIRRSYRPQFQALAESIIPIVGRERFHLLIYDEEKDRLLKALLGCLGLDTSGLSETPERINPALSDADVTRMLVLNASFDSDDEGSRYSDELMKLTGTPAAVSRAMPRECHDHLASEYGSQVDLVNELLGRTALTTKRPETQLI